MAEVIIGTPYHKLSKIEYHPQCDTNVAIALYAKTCTCGVQSHITLTFLILLRNPSDVISKQDRTGPWMVVSEWIIRTCVHSA